MACMRRSWRAQDAHGVQKWRMPPNWPRSSVNLQPLPSSQSASLAHLGPHCSVRASCVVPPMLLPLKVTVMVGRADVVAVSVPSAISASLPGLR